MKPLLPTLKERKRYVVYQVLTAHPLRRSIRDELLASLTRQLGVQGMAEAGILSVTHDQDAQTGILRVSHAHVAKLRAALLMTTHLGRTKVCIRTLGVSGILRKTARFTEAITCNPCSTR